MKVVTRFLGGCLALILATVTYIYGVWTGHFFELRATDEYCADKPLASPPTSWTWFPLKHLCRWNDGTSTSLVPAYVNPLLFACLATALVCMTLAIREFRRNQDKTRSIRNSPN